MTFLLQPCVLPVTVQVIFPLRSRLGQYLNFVFIFYFLEGELQAFLMKFGDVPNSVREMILWRVVFSVLTSPIDELLMIMLLTIALGLNKSVICICDFIFCSLEVVGNIRFLAGGIGDPVQIACLGFLEVEALTTMSHRFSVYGRPS